MGTSLSICNNSSDDPEFGPSSYIDYHEKRERLQQERLQGLHKEKIDIGKVAFDSLWYDVENYLFPVKEDEEELRVDDMTQEQLRQYYHE